MAKTAVLDIMKILSFYGYQGDMGMDILMDVYQKGAESALKTLMDMDKKEANQPINLDEIPF